MRIRITGTDLLTLDVHASFVARLDDPTTSADDAVVDAEDAEESEAAAAPLALAIDVDEAPVASGDTPAPAA